MKRWLIAVAVLAGPLVGLASADYVIIKLDLNNPYGTTTYTMPKGPGEGGTGGEGGGGREGPGGIVPPGGEGGEQKPVEKLPPRWVYANIEVYKAAKYESDQNFYKIEYRPNNFILVHKDNIKVIPSVTTKWGFEKTIENQLKEGDDADRLLLLADWALQRGLFEAFEKCISRLETLDKDHPRLLAVKQTQQALGKTLKEDNSPLPDYIEGMKDQKYHVVNSPHYTLLTNLPQKDRAIEKRLELLETLYKSYFLWFALKGHPQQVPTTRLLAVLIKADTGDRSGDFETKHGDYNFTPKVGDGFTARRDNLIVLSSGRLDDLYETLQKSNEDVRKTYKVGRDELLQDFARLNRQKPYLWQNIALLQTSTAIQDWMEMEAERATTTHAGARQLLAGSNILPRNLSTAEWARSGMASFFETPYRAFYSGVAGKSWTHLISFRHLRNMNKLEAKKSADVLLKVISDYYFNEYHDTALEYQDTTKDYKDVLQERLLDEEELARCTAWSLTYYLAHKRLDDLMNYFAELRKLPRDVEYDDNVLKLAFGRAFKLLTKDGNHLDMDRVRELAAAWFAYMETINLDITDVQQEALRMRMEEARGPNKAGVRPRPGQNPGEGGTGPGAGGGRGPGGSPVPPPGPPGGKGGPGGGSGF
jgi:hypothetical protein